MSKVRLLLGQTAGLICTLESGMPHWWDDGYKTTDFGAVVVPDRHLVVIEDPYEHFIVGAELVLLETDVFQVLEEE